MSIVKRYLEGYHLLSTVIDGLSNEEMKQVIEEGKWTIYENVIHVVDADLVYAERIKRILAEDSPVFLPFDQDAWTRRLNYHDRPLELYLELFRLIRESVASLLEEMDSDLWERSARKGEEEISLTQLVEALIDHVDNHVRTIQRLRNKMNTH